MTDDAHQQDDSAAPAAPDRAAVTRTVDIDADLDTVWRAVSDPEERARWLDDPDAAARRVRIDEARPGARLVWTWWHPGEEGDASTVTVDLTPATGGGTHVVVTEALRAAPPLAVAAAPRARPAPAWMRCARDRWDARVLGLELLLVVAAVPVG